MKWEKSQIQELKNRCEILQVAQALGVEVQHNRSRCFHPENHKNGDRTPSMSFQPEKNSFHCWVCPDVGGDVIAFVQSHQQIGFVEACNWLAEFTGMSNLVQRSGSHGPQNDQRNSKNIKQGIPTKTSTIKSRPTSELKNHGKTKTKQSLQEGRETELFHYPIKGSPAWLLRRNDLILEFLRACEPLDHQVMRYLNRRKIFKSVIDKQQLRWVKNYARVSDVMKSKFEMNELKEYGFFNDHQHLRFFKHNLIMPYLESDGTPVYFQARSIESDTTPKELNLKGSITIPYNRYLLNQEPGVIYLCEGVIDTLTLLEKGFQAVGVPGVKAFREDWVRMFENKKVYLAFDNDAPGREASVRIEALFKSNGLFVNQVDLPEGEDINSFFQRKKKK